MQRIVSPFLMNTFNVRALSSSVPNTAAFNEGYQMGSECSESDRDEGSSCHTLDEIWAFLQSELHPEHIKDELEHDSYGSHHVALEERIGFVVGYLTELATHQTTLPVPKPSLVCQMESQLSTPRYAGGDGFPLDM